MEDKLKKLKRIICEELGEYADRGVSAGNINAISQMAVAAEKIMKMEVLEMELEDGYSMDGGYSGRRRYSREGGSYADPYMDGDSFARRGGNRGRTREYSRDDGKSRMIEKMEDMLEEVKTPEEREALKKCIMQLKDM